MIYNKYYSLLLLLMIGAVVEVQAQTPAFDLLKAKFDAGEVFNATYSHTFTDSYTGESLSSQGDIWIASVSYRLESDEQVLIVNGITSQVYDQGRNRVIISEYNEEDDEFAPSRMLQGVDSTYSISERSLGKGRTEISLETNDDFAAYSSVIILLDNRSNPTQIIATDFAENEIITRFQNGKFIEARDELFELQYPNDAEIVDTRN